MMRRMSRIILVGAFVAAAGGWWFLRPPNPLKMDAGQVLRVEVVLEPWDENSVRAPVVASEGREAIAALVSVVRSGEETRDHKCGSRGIVTFRRSVGVPAELRFLPGHDDGWYEFRAGGKVYRVPRGEFVAAMRRVGVEIPLKCQP